MPASKNVVSYGEYTDSEEDCVRLRLLAEIQAKLSDVDYVRFTIADLHGISRGKLVPARSAPGFLRKGMGAFAGSQTINPRSLELVGLMEIESMRRLRLGGNLVMLPDLQTFRSISWMPGDYRVAEVLCDLRAQASKNTPLFNCSRSLAKHQLHRLSEEGFTLMSGTEMEFMLINKETLAPVYNGADFYSNLTLSDNGELLMGLEQALHKAGVNINDIHVEPAHGQFEINFEPAWGIQGGDWPFLIREALKEMASRSGMFANFMGRPWPKDSDTSNHCGNGAHFNHSLWSLDGRTNLFYSPEDPNHISPLAKHWVAGLLKHSAALTALVCPTVNCYRRMHGPWGPSTPSWGFDDRFATFRVKNFGRTSTYVENRVPSGLSNPYIVLAGNIAAGLDGIINQIELPPPRSGKETIKVPGTLEEALRALETSDVMRGALGPEFIEYFCAVKREGEIDKLPLSNMEVDGDLMAFKAEMEMYGKFM